MPGAPGPRSARPGSAFEVFLAFLRLGLTSFGGPVAHLGYFHSEFVERRRWCDDRVYAEYVALAQFLPGPASSQVGLAVGAHRAGLPGSIAAWLGFTLPSAVIMIALGLGIGALGTIQGHPVLQGLKLVAVAVVVQALWQMAQRLCPDRRRAGLAVVSALIVLLLPTTLGQLLAMVGGALVGLLWLRDLVPEIDDDQGAGPWQARRFAVFALLLFAVLLIGLPLAAAVTGNPVVEMTDGFYRAGSLVFGGGHVLLPLLEAQVVPQGWSDKSAFLAGYGAAQALPGPLFTFAGYLGALPTAPLGGLLGALLCIVAVFLPSFLLILGVLPFWSHLRRIRPVVAAVTGTNAAVVGVLLAALYDPLWVGAVGSAADFALMIAALALLAIARMPAWLVVLLGALAAMLFGL